MDEYLVARRCGTNNWRCDTSAELADWFNRKVLSSVYDRANRDATPAQVLTEYRLLVDEREDATDDLSAELKAHGIDPDGLRGEMIPVEIMERHLKACLEATDSPIPRGQPTERRIESLRARLSSDVQSVLSESGSAAGISSDEVARVEEVLVLVSCPTCANATTIRDALEMGYVCESHYPL
ncbi:rod-determining factor RdfA [Halegenticoccus soli]|uniref:rod-determining factor RdfA n=1 Tax=Halegenticoccus soli TaxID=1985678 RepID=UPI00117B5F4C|nr:rod-determining factor RdfA [Halegenticoccus soli]